MQVLEEAYLLVSESLEVCKVKSKNGEYNCQTTVVFPHNISDESVTGYQLYHDMQLHDENNAYI